MKSICDLKDKYVILVSAITGVAIGVVGVGLCILVAKITLNYWG